jgi:glyoxylase I family protein
MIEDLLHVGIGVKDIKNTIHFYKNIMGMDIEYNAHNMGKQISKVVGVKDAELQVCVMKKGNIRIELIDYGNNSNKTKSGYKCQDELGLLHIAFRVKDIDNEYKRIKSMGYEFNSPPMICRKRGPKICYFKGPDNVIIELYEKQ